MSLAEFQKYHDEMKAFKVAGKHAEFAKRFAAKNSTFMGPLHEPVNASDAVKLAGSEKLAGFLKADIEVKLDEVTQIGDVVVDRSTIVAKLPSGDKTGWNLTIWVKEDGQWKVRNSCTTFKADLSKA